MDIDSITNLSEAVFWIKNLSARLDGTQMDLAATADGTKTKNKLQKSESLLFP